MRSAARSVFVGSFNADAAVRTDVNPDGVALFEKEQAALMGELEDIPRRAADRKINDLVKRIRAFQVRLRACRSDQVSRHRLLLR